MMHRRLVAAVTVVTILGVLISATFAQAPTPALTRDSERTSKANSDDTEPTDKTPAVGDGQNNDSDPAALLRRPPSPKSVKFTLDEVVALGLRNNLDVQIEQLASYRSSKDIQIASAAFDPLFTTTYSMLKSREPTVDTLSGLGATTVILVNPSVTQDGSIGISGLLSPGTTYSLVGSNNRRDTPDSGFFGFNPRNSTDLTLTVTQPLLRDFGYDVTLADLRIAEENARVAVEALEDQVEATIAAIRDAYWALLLAQEVIVVRFEGLREAYELLEINQNKLAVGNATEIDVMSANAEIAGQRSELIRAQNDLDRARDTLLDLINYREVLRERDELGGDVLSPYEEFGVELLTTTSVTDFPINLDSAIRLALDERADLKQQRRQVRVAELDHDRFKRQLLPKFDVEGRWSFRGLEENLGNASDELFSGRYYTWRVGVTFEYPFGNRQARANVLKSEAEVEASRLRLRRSENAATLEVSQAVRDLRSRYETVQQRVEESRLRKEQLAGEQERLKVGTSTAYDVLQISNDLLDARLEEVRAQIDYQNAITAYKRAVGVLRREYRPPTLR